MKDRIKRWKRKSTFIIEKNYTLGKVTVVLFVHFNLGTIRKLAFPCGARIWFSFYDRIRFTSTITSLSLGILRFLDFYHPCQKFPRLTVLTSPKYMMFIGAMKQVKEDFSTLWLFHFEVEKQLTRVKELTWSASINACSRKPKEKEKIISVFFITAYLSRRAVDSPRRTFFHSWNPIKDETRHSIIYK